MRELLILFMSLNHYNVGQLYHNGDLFVNLSF